ncbi:MAG: thiamine pyrophosphate-dependent enzyme, partial [Nitrosomonas sp.]|nr:thiamine pyrophosphate-dependent enzyme [Nitrosomonas sp.]
MSKQLFDDSLLFVSNAPFIEEIYEEYLQNPTSVSSAWREYFNQINQEQTPTNRPLNKPAIKSQTPSEKKPNRLETITVFTDTIQLDTADRKQVAILQLINMYRYLGLSEAKLDPLNITQISDLPELDPAYFGFTDEDLDTEFNTGSLVGPEHATLREILRILRETYCGSVGAEYMYITSIEQKRWIQSRLEGQCSNPNYSNQYKLHILERLNAAEGLEKYLHTRYVGQKRFSGEGNESLIPLLDCLIQRAGEKGVQEIVLGMAHRARLNVLVNTLGKMPADLFREFEGKHVQDLPSGDVKYHQGFSSAIMTSGGIVRLALAFNPSHLEIVNPVVEGSVRARQHRLRDRQGDHVLPILLHGDAAFAGQGVVMETLNLSQTRGYGT